MAVKYIRNIWKKLYQTFERKKIKKKAYAIPTMKISCYLELDIQVVLLREFVTSAITIVLRNDL